MATTYQNTIRTENDDQPDIRHGFLLATYAGLIVGTIAAATGIAVLLAGATNGLGQFALLAGGWLAVMSASPEIAKRGTARVAEMEISQRSPSSNRAVDAVVTYVLAR